MQKRKKEQGNNRDVDMNTDIQNTVKSKHEFCGF